MSIRDLRRSAARCNQSLNSATGPVIESLEFRRHLSASLSADGTLYVLGTRRCDDIGISIDSEDATKIDLCMNGSWRQFDRAAVQRVIVAGRGGNDNIHIDEP